LTNSEIKSYRDLSVGDHFHKVREDGSPKFSYDYFQPE
jgi:hypothetical protein